MAPPPLPRRHSNPNASTDLAQRTYKQPSPSRHTNYSPDTNSLRHELFSLDLNKQEVKNWLGSEDKLLEESETESNLEVPLQRSLSLDGGIEIFKYLQNIDAQFPADSCGSAWTVDSDDDGGAGVFKYYESLKDVPTSQVRVRSRKASLEIEKAFFGEVLREKHEGPNIFISGTSTGDVDSSAENLNTDVSGVGSRKLFYRDISVEPNNTYYEDKQKPSSSIVVRRPRLLRNLSYQDCKKSEMNLRKEILMRGLSNHQSCGDLRLLSRSKPMRRASLDSKTNLPNLGFKLLKDSYKGVEFDIGNVAPNILKLRRNFSFRGSSEFKERLVPTVNVTNLDAKREKGGIAKTENKFSEASKVVLSSNCDCQICLGGGDSRTVFSSVFSKLLITAIRRDRRRKLSYWDENNNLKEGEMYCAIMQILKLMFGIWLRHWDHN